jgi:putative transposase
MKQNSSGGRSSATPTNRGRARRSSPLQLPERKAPTHFPAVESGFRSIIIYLTVCTRRRRPLLANNEAARLILSAWQAANFWCVGRYVIMPDHIHLFCAPAIAPAMPLQKWIEFWRNKVTREWTNRNEVPIWQRDYWDTQLRHRESYSTKWEYVRNNPVRHGFVARAEDWPYQGELNVLEWHDR